MHNPLPRVIMSGLVAAGVASATEAISLSNFTPRIEDLSSSCQAAYTTEIQGCQASDFTRGARCSSSCVQGLVKISQIVTQQCGNDDVPETSIIGVFLLGQGIPVLCPGVEVTTIGASSTQASPSQQTSTPAQVTSTAEAQPSSSSQATDTAPSASSATPATSAANTPNQSVAPPSSSAQQPQLTFATGSPSPVPSQTASIQKSNQDSGGGSPFDVVATGSSSRLGLGGVVTAALFGLGVLLGVMI